MGGFVPSAPSIPAPPPPPPAVAPPPALEVSKVEAPKDNVEARDTAVVDKKRRGRPGASLISLDAGSDKGSILGG